MDPLSRSSSGCLPPFSFLPPLAGHGHGRASFPSPPPNLTSTNGFARVYSFLSYGILQKIFRICPSRRVRGHAVLCLSSLPRNLSQCLSYYQMIRWLSYQPKECGALSWGVLAETVPVALPTPHQERSDISPAPALRIIKRSVCTRCATLCNDKRPYRLSRYAIDMRAYHYIARCVHTKRSLKTPHRPLEPTNYDVKTAFNNPTS